MRTGSGYRSSRSSRALAATSAGCGSPLTSEDAERVEHERLHQRLVVPGSVAARGPHVAGAEVGLEEHLGRAVVQLAQAGHPLRRLVVADPRIVQTGGDQQAWVVGPAEVVEG